MDPKYDRSNREKAWIAVRLAVRAYAREPSEDNASRVQTAWDSIRNMEEQALRRVRLAGRSEQPTGPVAMH